MREVGQKGNDKYIEHEEGYLSEIGTWGHIHK